MALFIPDNIVHTIVEPYRVIKTGFMFLPWHVLRRISRIVTTVMITLIAKLGVLILSEERTLYNALL